jgi:phosphate transport system substrate-binding protein
MNNRTIRHALTTAAAVFAAFSLVAGLAAAGAGASPKAHDPYLYADTRIDLGATIGGAGSTFAAPLQNAAQAFYTSRNPRASINGYQAVGSGTGEADVLKKVVDWGGTDVPMQQKDIYKSEPSGDNYQVSQFLQVPIALGGVAIAYNVPGLKDKALVLNANCLAWIYSGQVEYWNSKVIQNLNKGVKLPHQRIVVVARGDSSGTTFIFTNFLHAAAPKAWPTLPSKSALTLPVGGIAGSGNAGVASDVQNTTDSIGYVEYSYLLLNPSLLRGVVAVVNKSGKAVQPSIAGVAAAAAARPAVSATGFSIVWQWGSKTYPIAGYTWAVIWKQNQTSDAEGTLLVKYLDWLSHSGAINGTTAGQDVAVQQGYVPLPANIQQLARTTLLQCVGSHGQALLTTTGA